MPRKRNGEIPLPEGWDFAQDYDGKVYFIDHNTKKTTWIDPRDRFTKPQSFADCIGNELPLGWEEAFDPHIGVYYINHVSQCTQLEDPRLEWRAIQEAMLREYLTTAQDVLEAKKEIYDVKQQRLYLAQDEYNHLNNALLNNSRSSLCSSSSSASTKYDVDLLKSDVALARDRVSRLKRELEQIRTEMNYTQRGVDTLASVEQKLGATGTDSTGGCYNITEVQAIMAELLEIEKSLRSGEKERSELMQSLAKLKDELTRLELCGDSSPDVSTLNLTLSTASQTDLCAELVPMGTRLAEMARMRLEYDETRKRIQIIQTQLADLEEKVTPGQAESDKDRLILFQEKEQLLRELRSIISSSSRARRSHEEMSDIQADIRKLEQDLKDALEMSNRAIADRLRLHEEKQLLLSQLRDALRSMTLLESQLRSLSASTLSVSSSSSLGSLSTTSSKGSLSSGLSFTDIYVPSSCITMSDSGANTSSVNMADLHKRVERLLKGDVATPPPPLPPPPYEAPPTTSSSLGELLYKGTNMSQGSGLGRPSSPLSPISETPPLETGGPPSPPSTRSVSAAVSDESVAGDSGVFEASHVKRHLSDSSQCETAQVQIKLRYSSSDSTLHISIEKARSLSALLTPEADDQVFIKASLLPSGPGSAFTCTTKPVSAATNKPRFGETFAFSPLPLSKLCSKTLQVNVWTVSSCAEKRVDCVGCAQVSLADFTLAESYSSSKWYNILSFKCFQAEDPVPSTAPALPSLPPHITTVKEESSDESTIISSQTSTLTRNQGCEGVPCEAVSLKLEQLNREFVQSSSGEATGGGEEEYEEEEEEEDSSSEEEDEEEDMMAVFCLDNSATHDRQAELCQVLEEIELDPTPPPVTSEDKTTNTECVFVPGKSSSHHGGSVTGSGSKSIVIKRSQTFSPVARNSYICRLNRSESDSSMPLYRRTHSFSLVNNAPFRRNSVERRSLRWHRQIGTGSMRCKSHHSGPRTSLDLELDLRAQHTKLQSLQDEIQSLRNLKSRLELAKEKNDVEIANWVLEDAQFQHLISQADGKSADDKKVEKLLKKTSREIYKLRKHKAGKGKPDLISFKEKMAFFTRANNTIPLPPSPLATDPSPTQEKPRFEYTVDRNLGVEV
ncbi:hypothetical protein M8J77_005331 [Diaphorina citri]|nr:hypothetical protein M8J77_005331 [Diaphorina citri]